MKLNQYLNNNKATHLPITLNEQAIDDVYFRRLSAGEGLQLKESFADLLAAAGDLIPGVGDGKVSEADVAKVEEDVRSKMTPEQLRVMFQFQALFAFLHMGNKDGSRAYVKRDEFDQEVPDEFVQEFYRVGSELKNKTEPDQEKAEKNS